MNDQEFAGLPEVVRSAFAICNAELPDYDSDGTPNAWFHVRDELLRLARENAELQQSLDRLHGARFSDRAYAALKYRAERGEAELAAMKRKIAGTTTAEVFEGVSGAGIIYSTGGLPREWIGQRVALLPVGGE